MREAKDFVARYVKVYILLNVYHRAYLWCNGKPEYLLKTECTDNWIWPNECKEIKIPNQSAIDFHKWADEKFLSPMSFIIAAAIIDSVEYGGRCGIHKIHQALRNNGLLTPGSRADSIFNFIPPPQRQPPVLVQGATWLVNSIRNIF